MCIVSLFQVQVQRPNTRTGARYLAEPWRQRRGERTHPWRQRRRSRDVLTRGRGGGSVPVRAQRHATTTTTHPRLQACGACMCHRQHALFVPFIWSFSYQVHGEGTTPSQDEPPLICSPPEKGPRWLHPEEHDVTPQRRWMKS